jgi:hypothetical protein
MFFEVYSIAERLPDSSGKPGEDLCIALCRTCSGKPELVVRRDFI